MLAQIGPYIEVMVPGQTAGFRMSAMKGQTSFIASVISDCNRLFENTSESPLTPALHARHGISFFSSKIDLRKL
jgi:hypothetical protein